jgi:hypothetical protein
VYRKLGAKLFSYDKGALSRNGVEFSFGMHLVQPHRLVDTLSLLYKERPNALEYFDIMS